jgi:hypothetical protein
MLEQAKHYGRTNLPPTGVNGVFAVKQTHAWSKISLTLSCTNYVTCYGHWDSGPLCYSESRKMFESDMLFEDEFYLDGTILVAQRSNGFEIILMRPK